MNRTTHQVATPVDKRFTIAASPGSHLSFHGARDELLCIYSSHVRSIPLHWGVFCLGVPILNKKMTVVLVLSCGMLAVCSYLAWTSQSTPVVAPVVAPVLTNFSPQPLKTRVVPGQAPKVTAVVRDSCRKRCRTRVGREHRTCTRACGRRKRFERCSDGCFKIQTPNVQAQCLEKCKSDEAASRTKNSKTKTLGP
jgi:hypothetical protein